jgi:hypothetical protein
MNENQEITRLQEKLDALITRHDSFQREIADLRNEIILLKAADLQQVTFQDEIIPEPITAIPLKEEKAPEIPAVQKSPKPKSDLEKFVGENLINKIGIVITIIGVGIGAKYAIDHDLISPWTRIILGYIVGLGLLGFALRLKKQYMNFSAVLLSGSMAILYFLTYAAFAFYDLIPQWLTFALMVMITVLTVSAALNYGQQVIAHIGLVGAYAVPFLLSNDSGNVAILFSYMALINTGILVIAFKKYWKSLYYSSFSITWLIVLSWYVKSYLIHEHFTLALVFISVFFIIFYTIFLAYKLLKKELFEIEDILMILGNSSIFYGLCYAVLQLHDTGELILGLLTLGNALIHCVICLIIYRQKQADRNLMYFVGGLALVFVTIAIPVGLNGNWVTLLWSGEVAILFWIGRTKNTIVYELISYPLMFLAFFSLVNDWLEQYHFFGSMETSVRITPIFNIIFLTSLVLIASLAFINVISSNKKYNSPLHARKWLLDIMNIIMPAMLIIALYTVFVLEISTFWNQLFLDSTVTVKSDLTIPEHLMNSDIIKYNNISIIDYSLLFFSILSLVNTRKFKSSLLGSINQVINTIVVGLFLTIGLYTIGELRDSYLGQLNTEYFYRGWWNIGIRYISFVFLGLILFSIKDFISKRIIEMDLNMEFDFVLHITILTVLSNELINWMDIFKSEQSYKLGLSILWGLYALYLIAYGIWKKKKHLRIGAIVLFAITLLKLFFYDISSLDTISKTIVLVSLGALLLIISFLYNKYKKLIF